MLGILKVLLAVGALITIGTVLSEFRTRRLVASRPPADLAAFIASFDGEVSVAVLTQVFSYLQRYMGSQLDFPVLASDDLCSIYGVVNGDLEDTVEELLDGLGRRLSDPPFPTLDTVGDLALFLESCPSVSFRQA